MRERLGIVEEGQRRSALYAPKPVEQPRPVLKVRPIYEKGRYIPKSLNDLMALVCRHAGISLPALTGLGRSQRLVNARACVANLAEEFCPHQSADAVDNAMLRGSGLTIWHRQRHRDRIELHPEYGALYERCRAELVK